jgi:hypothetical protein
LVLQIITLTIAVLYCGAPITDLWHLVAVSLSALMGSAVGFFAEDGVFAAS